LTSGLIVNENFPAPATQLLRANGIDVLSVQEIMPGASDEAVLAKAIETGRWLITFDRDYGELVFSKKCAPPRAIVYIRQEPVPRLNLQTGFLS
jgi:predicted nuclease of predicted toxin-antitoxin system